MKRISRIFLFFITFNVSMNFAYNMHVFELFNTVHHFAHHKSGHKMEDFISFLLFNHHHNHNNEDKNNDTELPVCNHANITDNVAVQNICHPKEQIIFRQFFNTDKKCGKYNFCYTSFIYSSIWQPPKFS